MVHAHKILAFALLICLSIGGPSFAETVKDIRKKMGSRFEITAVHLSGDQARTAIEAAYAEIDRLEAMISSWRENSETSAVNRNAGKTPTPVSRELFNLTRRALKVSELTDGAFDITFAGVGGLWNFKSDPPKIPEPSQIKDALSLIDYRRIKLNPLKQTVFLEGPGMRMGFGAIGKGYAANRAVFILKEHGITDGLVNAGGDLVAFGEQEDGAPWQIAIAHPRRPDQVFARLRLTEQAVVTSGDYENFLMVDGKRYSHIINPKTGYPAHELVSVTIICPDAELADALATATFVMGPQKGVALINRLKNIECLMVDVEGKIHYSKNVQSQMTYLEDNL